MRFQNVESLVIDYLNNSDLSVEAFASVPEKRPESFITVERTGGSRIDVARQNAVLAIQVWAKSRFEASMLADEVDAELYDLKFSPYIYKFDRVSLHNFPDLTSKTARYQIIISLITSINS